MKTKSIIALIIICFSSHTLSETFLQKQHFMRLSTIEKKWGKKKFNLKKFKSSSFEDKAKMTANLIKSKAYIGKPLSKVFSDLGHSTGYFSNDSIPAYAIGNIHEKPDELWQIVFLPERDSQKVKDVKVHKKCCH